MSFALFIVYGCDSCWHWGRARSLKAPAHVVASTGPVWMTPPSLSPGYKGSTHMPYIVMVLPIPGDFHAGAGFF